MRTVVVVGAVTALMMGVLIVSPTGGFADESIRVTGEAREVQLGDTHLQIIPTNKGVYVVQGELVRGGPTGPDQSHAAYTHTGLGDPS